MPAREWWENGMEKYAMQHHDLHVLISFAADLILILIKWLKSKTENLLCKAVYKFVEVLRGDCPDVLVDNTVEIEVQGVVTSPEKVDYDIVINIHVGES